MTSTPSYARSRYLALSLTVAFIACYRLPPPQSEKVTVAAEVLDLSLSTDTSTRCDELIARAESYLDLPSTERFDLIAFGTSDETTDSQPIVLVPWKRYQRTHRLYGKRLQREQARHLWLKEVAEQCRERVRSMHRSPIFAGIAAAVESVAAHCAEIREQGLECGSRYLAIHSDMEESSSQPLAARLAEVQRLTLKGRKITKRPQALPQLDLSGFTNIVICGSSNHFAQPQGGYDPLVLHQVWTEVLGDHLPSFDASCPNRVLPSSALVAKRGTP